MSPSLRWRTVFRWSSKRDTPVLPRGAARFILIVILCLTSLQLYHGLKRVPVPPVEYIDQEGLQVGDWTLVYEDQEDQIYVYTAYYDTRDPGQSFVRVIGATTGSHLNLVCWLYANGSLHYDFPRKRHLNFYKTKFAVVLVSCRWSQDHAPKRILLLKDDDKAEIKTRGYIQVIPIPRRTPVPRHQIGACYQPLNNHYGDLYKTFLHLEILWSLGVDKFIVYYNNDSVSAPLAALLQHYVVLGRVVPVQWNLFVRPRSPRDLISVYGQYAQLADCFYRFMYDFEYLFNLDMDEFPVLVGGHNWKPVLGRLFRRPYVSHYALSNSYVLVSPSNNSHFVPSDVFSDDVIVTRPCTGDYISKYVARPDRIVWPYVHEVLESVPGYWVGHMMPETATTFHIKRKNQTLYCSEDPSSNGDWLRTQAHIRTNFTELCARVFPDPSVCYDKFML